MPAETVVVRSPIPRCHNGVDGPAESRRAVEGGIWLLVDSLTIPAVTVVVPVEGSARSLQMTGMLS